MDPAPPHASAIQPYYRGVNADLLEIMPLTAAVVLEVGCGAGALARAYRERNPMATYIGVESFEAAAAEAGALLAHIVVGDVEAPSTMEAVDACREGRQLDLVVLGDVLEHLRDPWALVGALRARTAPDGVCVASLPNVAHWSLILQQLRGRWDYARSGLLDRTHIRFFTRQTAIEMFTKAGWHVLDSKPRILAPEKTAAAIAALRPGAESLGLSGAEVEQDLAAFQWVIRAVNGAPATPLHLVGLGSRRAAGVTEPRLDHPLGALSTLPDLRVVWGAPTVAVPRHFQPGVLVLHRYALDNPRLRSYLERMCAQGWLLVLDFDDSPWHWPHLVDSDFLPFRFVHAVTVTTERLAQEVRRWNPTVAVFANAVDRLPISAAPDPKPPGKARVFFGALNRQQDWNSVAGGIAEAARILGDRAWFVFVHDRAAHDGFPPTAKELHPTLPPDRYLALLASCDVALLPLLDTPFNRMKSDLKLIESAAAGAVPICSPTIYAERPEHREIARFADTPGEWCEALVSLCSDRAALAALRAKGRAYVAAQRMHAGQVAERAGWYRAMLADLPALEALRRARVVALSSG